MLEEAMPKTQMLPERVLTRARDGDIASYVGVRRATASQIARITTWPFILLDNDPANTSTFCSKLAFFTKRVSRASKKSARGQEMADFAAGIPFFTEGSECDKSVSVSRCC